MTVSVVSPLKGITDEVEGPPLGETFKARHSDLVGPPLGETFKARDDSKRPRLFAPLSVLK